MADRSEWTSLFSRKRRGGRNRDRGPARRFPPLLESLERRCLLAADLGTAESSIFWQGETVATQSNSWIVRTEAGQPTVLAHLPDWQLTPLGTGFYGLHAPGASSTDVLGWAASTTGVSYVEPDFVIAPTAVPNDPSYSRLWGLSNTGQSGGSVGADIDATTAWDTTTGSDDVVIAVIDTGVDSTHPDLADNIWTNPGEIAGNGIDDDGNGYVDDIHGYDFYANDADPMDDEGHGTHVAGTIGAVGNNGLGITGVAWDVSIMAMRFLGPGGGYTSDAIAAVNYVTEMRRAGVNVVATNNSWGGGGFSQSLSDAIAAGYDAGVLFVAAAGNDGTNNDVLPHYPSNDTGSGVISVAATTRTNSLASFSNYGVASVDLAAPGASIYSTTPGNSYDSYSGTSMATPHVSGVIALMAAANPAATPAQLRTALLESVTPLGSLTGRVATGGLLDAAAAVAAITGAAPPDDTDPGEPPADDPPVTGVGEPNDTLAAAVPLNFNLGEAEVEAFVGDGTYLAADVDLYSLELTAGTTVTFDIDARGLSGSSPLDSYLRLFDATGAEVAANDDDDTSFDSLLSYTATAAGGYVLGVSAFSNSSYDPNTAGTGSAAGSMGRYTLRVDLAEPAEPPADDPPVSGAGEPNDSFATATVLTFTAGEADFEAVIGDGVHETADVDLYSLDLAAGETVTIDIDAAALAEPSSLDSYLRLFDAVGSEVAFNDDDGSSFDSQLTFTAESAGSYVVGVSGYANSVYDPLVAGTGSTAGSTGAYTLRVDRAETEPPVHDDPEPGTNEPNDAGSTATALVLDLGRAEVDGTIGDGDHADSDVDLYSVSLTAGDVVSIDIDAQTRATPSTLDSLLRLFDATGVEVAFNDDDGSSFDSLLSYTVEASGSYLIGVSAYGNSSYDPLVAGTGAAAASTGRYTLEVEVETAEVDDPPAADPAEPNDSLATATAVPFNTDDSVRLSGFLGDGDHADADIDLYSLTLTAGSILTADVDARTLATPSRLDSFLRIFDASGTELTANDDDDASFDSFASYTATVAGTYYVGVSSFGNEFYDPSVPGSGFNRSTGSYELSLAIDAPETAPEPPTEPPTMPPVAAEEPNDAVATAIDLPLLDGKARAAGTIGDGDHGLADVDLFAVTLGGGDTIRIDVDARTLETPSWLDSYLRLFDSLGNELAGNDDDDGSFDSRIEFTTDHAGIYYIGVSAYGNSSYDPFEAGGGSEGRSAEGVYELSIRVHTESLEAVILPVDPEERTEPIESLTIIFTQPVTGFDKGDLQLTRDGTPVSLDGKPLTSTDGVVWTISGLQAATAALGEYELVLNATGSGITTATGELLAESADISWEVLTGTTEEPGSTIDKAERIASGAGPIRLTGTIGDGDDRRRDVDLYAVQLAAGQTMTVDVDAESLASGSTLDSFLRLFDSSGRQLAQNDDTAFSFDSLLTHTVQLPGTYYVGISGYGNSRYEIIDDDGARRGSVGDYEVSFAFTEDDPATSGVNRVLGVRETVDRGGLSVVDQAFAGYEPSDGMGPVRPPA